LWVPFFKPRNSCVSTTPCRYDHALATADKHAFYKFMVREVAKKHGYRVTFMAKPFVHLTGNSCHCHISLHDESGANVFDDPTASKDVLGLSPLALSFVGGLMQHCPAICAFGNPTINSYRRIGVPAPVSGSTWAPNAVSWGGNNRTNLIRVPDAPRFELRVPDGSAHPCVLCYPPPPHAHTHIPRFARAPSAMQRYFS
jgi:glutamine synthetase